jgi:hypothetical protein
MFCCALLRDSAGVPPVEGALYALNELLVGGESCCESCPGLAEVARIGTRLWVSVVVAGRRALAKPRRC